MSDIPSFSLDGKVIIQFGGSGLLGRALVSALAAAGATLVVASRHSASRPSGGLSEHALGKRSVP